MVLLYPETGGGEMCYNKIFENNRKFEISSIILEIIDGILDKIIDISLAKQLSVSHQKIESKITTSIVGSILDNLLSVPSPDKSSFFPDETVLLDDEIKQMIKDMKYPSLAQNVGDHLENELHAPQKVLSEPKKCNTLERKKRLANLVKNSKQFLTKFITNDTAPLRISKSEEFHEKLLKIIDLENNCPQPGCSTSEVVESTEINLNDFDAKAKLASKNVQCNSESKLLFILENKAKKNSEAGRRKESATLKKKCGFGTKLMKYFKRSSSKRE